MLGLSDEQRMIRETARAFAQDRLAPGAAERDRTAAFPAAELAEMGKLGLMGMMLDEQWGGSNAGNLAFALAIEQIAAADGALSTILSVHNGVGAVPIQQFGTEEQKRRFLPKIASGEWLAAFALSEPEAGSDAGAISCQARRDGNKYVLSGTKQFITGGQTAATMIVFAVTDRQAGKKGISAFVVPTDLPGYRVSSIEKKMGQRASDTAQVVFDDMQLAPGLLLGEEGQGYKIALSNLEGGRIGIAAQSIGMATAAFRIARDYAKERKSFGKAIAEHQAVAFRLADMATGIEAARGLMVNAARLRDAGLPCLKEASMAKLFASEMVERVCTDAIQTLGGYGYIEDYGVERIYRDARVCQIYEGTSDIQRLLIARAVLAED